MSETPSGSGEGTIPGASGILGVNNLQRAVDTFDKAVTTLAGIVGTLKAGTAGYQAGQQTTSSWNRFSNWMGSNGGNPTFGGTPFNQSPSSGGAPPTPNGGGSTFGGAHAAPGPAQTGSLSDILSMGGGQHGSYFTKSNFGKVGFAVGAASSAASAIHAATGMSTAAYQTTAATMASTAQVMSTGQSVNAPALFKNGGQYAFSGTDQAAANMGIFQSAGYAPNTGGFRSYQQFVGQQGMANPMMSAQQAQQSVSSFYTPSGIVGLHQVGITTVQRGGQRMSPINIANQILTQVDPQQTVRTPDQIAQLVNDPNSPLNLTMGNWVSSGLMDGNMAQQVRDQVTMILKARQHGVSATQLQGLVNKASNGDSGAQSTLKGMQIGNSVIQENKNLDAAKRGNMVQGLSGFELGVEKSTQALTQFTDALNSFEQATGLSFLTGLYRGGTLNGKLGGLMGAASVFPGGGEALSLMNGAISGAGGVIGGALSHLGIGGNNDSRMSTTSGAGGGASSGSAGASKGGGGGSTHMIWPVGHAPITEAYGVKNSMYAAGHHTGVDFGVPVGTPIHAAASGTVVNAGPGGAYGTYIVVDLHNGLWTLYAHCSRLVVGMGAQVRQGQVIAYSGATGNVTGPHLHFEVRKGSNVYGADVNPMPYLGGAGMPAASGGSSTSGGGTSGGQSTGSGSSTNLGSGTSYMSFSSGGGGGQAYGAGMSELDVLGSAPSASGSGSMMMIPTSGTPGIGSAGPGPNSPHPGGGSFVGGVNSPTPGQTVSGGTPSAGGNRGLGMQIASHYGWGTGAEWNALDKLWTQESGWRTNATNPHSGAYGIAQALPPSKYGTVAPDWRVNPATQIEWGLMYIKNRYGDPLHAWAHEVADNWYDKGAWDMPSDQTARVHKGEMILPAPAARQIREILVNGNPYKANSSQPGTGGSIVFEKDSIHITIKSDGSTSAQTGRALAKEFVDTLTLDRRIKALQGGRF